tara:strand:- start:2551 stop:3234 length:684 start_codon:yes stop_codon:yes gene_type:complete
MSCIALIPARSGSKGVPRKNIKLFNGKPLIYWSIKNALNNKNIERVIISTDSSEIAEIAESFSAEVPFLRPLHLAQDNTPGIETVKHLLKELPCAKDILLLQPTSPLRRRIDIDNIFALRSKYGTDSAISLTPCSVHPNLIHQLNQSNNIEPLIKNSIIENRQSMERYYTVNGALYLSTRESIEKYNSLITPNTVGYVMPEQYSVDIDTPLDWEIAEYLMRKSINNS